LRAQGGSTSTATTWLAVIRTVPRTPPFWLVTVRSKAAPADSMASA